MSITVTDIVTEYGAYYENAGQNKDRLKKLLMQPVETEKYCTVVTTEDTTWKLGKSLIEKILQPFQNGWTPKSAASFKPNVINLRKLKVDEEFNPDDIEDTWLGFLAANEMDRKNWPVVRYLIEELYINKLFEDWENEAIFKGVYDAPTPNVAGDPADVIDGFRKLIIDGINDSTINRVTLSSALAADNIFESVETFADSISGVYKNKSMNLFMSPTWARAYKRDKRNEFGYTDNNLSGAVDFTNLSVIGLPSMEGSNVIFTTPKENMFVLNGRRSKSPAFTIEGLKRMVYFYTDFWKGVGFGLNEAVWAYIPDSELNGSGSGS